MSKIHYTTCPVCGSGDMTELFKAKDHTVSGELFGIMECRNCTLRFTQDVPDVLSIGPYYQSEDYISHTNTQKGIVNRLYHVIRKRTLAQKRKMIQQVTGLGTGQLLDIGSGTGAFVSEMKTSGWQTTGLEPDTGARKLAKEQYGIDLEGTDKLFALPVNSFDAITLWHVLEHIHDLAGYTKQLRSLLKDTGKLFMAVPNYTSSDANFYQEYWAAYDVPRHLYHFSPHAMHTLMEKNDMKILRHFPMWYDSFYVSMLSSKYKNGKTNWPAAFWSGLRSNIATIGNVKKCSSLIYVITMC